ncbi:glycoside hydrolase family 2 protein [Arthrobacter tecti]
MKKLDLLDWQMGQLANGVVKTYFPASVPGSVLHDLVKARVIDDPYVGLGESSASWVAEADFRYESVIEVENGDDRIDLVAHGLDTDAVLRLDGVEIGRTRNQHRTYRFDLRSHTGPGSHVISIDLLSAVRSARAFEDRIEPKPLVGDTPPYNAIRKMACSFSSDWGPHLPTSGLWKPIGLERWDGVRLDEVQPRVRVDDGRGLIDITARLERTRPGDATLIAHLWHPDGSRSRTESSGSGDELNITMTVDSPNLWWPRGYGDQPLYRLTIELWSDGVQRDEWCREIGFRTVRVDSRPDDHGVPFTLQVNGQPILIKGANWTPDDFARPLVGADYPRSIADALNANMNLLRVWGGGIFESDQFYELCDRSGIMVWQDFLFSCACYSESEELAAEVAAEARQNILRLAPHPSLVLWNGGNETDEGYHNWGFRDRMPAGADWGDGYYRRMLPDLLEELDPDRPYIPSSPFSPENPSIPTDPNQGTSHSWKVWYSRDYTAYAETVPRFVAEFGFLGPPAYSTLLRALDGDQPSLNSPALISHQKADDGFNRLERGWTPHLPTPVDFDDWHFTTQLNQARAVRFGLQHFRSHWPRTAGSIVWQLKDCWPGIGYAAVDGDRHRKPLWHAIRSIYADRVLMFVERDAALLLVLGNDTPTTWGAGVTLSRRRFDGATLAAAEMEVEVPPRSSLTVPVPSGVLFADSVADAVLTAEAQGAQRAYWYGAEDIALNLPEHMFDASIEHTDLGCELTLEAHSFTKDLCLFPDRLDSTARVGQALVTLFPGERAMFEIESDQTLDLAALVKRPVLRTVNDLGRAGEHS